MILPSKTPRILTPFMSCFKCNPLLTSMVATFYRCNFVEKKAAEHADPPIQNLGRAGQWKDLHWTFRDFYGTGYEY